MGPLFRQDAERLVPSEGEGQEVGGKVGEEGETDGGHAEDKVAPEDIHPFAEAVGTKDVAVGHKE